MLWKLGLALAAAGNLALAQAPKIDPDEDFHVYTEAPRLLLTKQRLRLLQRERERESMRWQQFDGLVSGGALMPEVGLASALYYQVSGNAAAGKKAVDWALDEKTDATRDLRTLALIFDWCGAAMTPMQADRLAAKIQRGLDAPAKDAAGQTARALAAIAIADRSKDQGNAALKSIVEEWRAGALKRIESGQPAFPREQTYAVAELMHALRDNLKIDLRDSAPVYFKQLIMDHLTGHYPAPFPGSDNDVFVPVYAHEGDPNLIEATMSRAAGLALVAFDTNGAEEQYLQGWLLQDRYMMRDPLGSVYEFLWANPYQPGMSYSLLPLVFHNSANGDVFARTSWDDDATWIGYFDGQLQMFANGKLQTMRAGAAVKPLRIGDAVLMSAPAPAADGSLRIQGQNGTIIVLGLPRKAAYDVEIDDQELAERETDAGGTLVLALAPDIEAGIRLRKR